VILPPSYLSLPVKFRREVRPEVYPKPEIAIYNDELAKQLGVDLRDANILSGAIIQPGTTPLALGYAGHQFGNYTVLGDGRAVLLGEIESPDGKRWDIQLKGSGRTPFSRRGDGRASLGPMLREYIMSEALAALGIPTTRSLAVLTTGESVFRFAQEPGAILVRVAASHLRIGTFEYATDDEVGTLADFTIQRHYPELLTQDDKYYRFLSHVIARQGKLVAQWMSIGFIHGVMNTDNVALSGETIDFGPCAFMNRYDPATTYSSIDTQGRYAFGNQPSIMHWNLARFAETLLPLLADATEVAIKRAEEALQTFPVVFNAELERLMSQKLGGALSSLEELYRWMYEIGADYTNTFADLSLAEPSSSDDRFRAWHAKWKESVSQEIKNHHVIPRNRLVEEALVAAAQESNLTPLHEIVSVLRRPYERPHIKYRSADDTADYRTFCGT
jgi:uncharacterized protein YdiU (UPF0061 family)